VSSTLLNAIVPQLQVCSNALFPTLIVSTALAVALCGRRRITSRLFSCIRMWANAQRHGRPAEYRWHLLFNAAKFGWRPLYYRVPCSNDAKTRNTLKFAEVPQTPAPISAVSGLKFTILPGHAERYYCLTSFIRWSIYALVAKTQPNKVVRWCPYGDFLRHFCVLYFQRAACSAFQTCVLNSH